MKTLKQIAKQNDERGRQAKEILNEMKEQEINDKKLNNNYIATPCSLHYL